VEIHEKINAAPTTGWLRSRRHKNIGWARSLAEMIDNALDANATQIRISIDNRTVTISDDGHGIRDLAAVVTPGAHDAGEFTVIGMYGVGLKDAWHWIGTKMTVDTVHDGTRGTIEADTEKMERERSWLIDPPEYRQSTDAPRTSISIRLHDKDPKRGLPSQSHLDQLAWMFTPALLASKQILFRDARKRAASPLKPFQLPIFERAHDSEFEVNGKHVRLTAGIVPEGQRMKHGPMWIQYGHRNILGATAIGCKGYSTERIGGVVALGKGWKLSDHKDDLTDHKDELDDAIYDRISGLLEEAEKLAQDIENDRLEFELNDLLNEAWNKARKMEKERRRSSQGGSGPIDSITTGRKRRKAAVHDDKDEGSVEVIGSERGGKAKRLGIRMVFESFDSDETIGAVDAYGKRIRLNRDHPFVQEARKTQNLPALHAMALGVAANHACNVGQGGQRFLSFDAEEFNETLGILLYAMKYGEAEEK
jgi:hypothetical protein